MKAPNGNEEQSTKPPYVGEQPFIYERTYSTRIETQANRSIRTQVTHAQEAVCEESYLQASLNVRFFTVRWPGDEGEEEEEEDDGDEGTGGERGARRWEPSSHPEPLRRGPFAVWL